MHLFCRTVLCAVFLMLAHPGICASETLSGFLKANIKNSVLVIEGDRYIDKDQNALKNIVTSASSEKAAILSIAEACDYTVQVDDGAYLLRKRYSSPLELPCVSKEEILSYLQDVEQATLPLAYTGKKQTFMGRAFQLLKALTPDQWQQAKTELLPIRSLNGEQRTLFDAMVMEAFYGDVRPLTVGYLDLWNKPSKAKLFVQPIRKGTRVAFRSSNPVVHEETVIYPERVPSKAEVQEAEDLNASLYGTVLREVLAQLNSSSDPTNFQAAQYLLQTPVSVINLKKATPRRVMRSIGHLYGFRILSNDTGMKLERQRIANGKMADIGSRVASALPLPIKRVSGRSNFEEPTRRLLFFLVTQIEKSPSKYVAVDQLSPSQSTILAYNQFTRLVREIFDSAGGFPAYLQDTDTLYLKFRRTPSTALGFQSGVSFGLVRERNGKFSNGLQAASINDVDLP